MDSEYQRLTGVSSIHVIFIIFIIIICVRIIRSWDTKFYPNLNPKIANKIDFCSFAYDGGGSPICSDIVIVVLLLLLLGKRINLEARAYTPAVVAGE